MSTAKSVFQVYTFLDAIKANVKSAILVNIIHSARPATVHSIAHSTMQGSGCTAVQRGLIVPLIYETSSITMALYTRVETFRIILIILWTSPDTDNIELQS